MREPEAITAAWCTATVPASRPGQSQPNPFHRKAFEQAIGDVLRAAATFLGRLEHEMHRAGP
jgi:hypothetical protein